MLLSTSFTFTSITQWLNSQRIPLTLAVALTSVILSANVGLAEPSSQADTDQADTNQADVTNNTRENSQQADGFQPFAAEIFAQDAGYTFVAPHQLLLAVEKAGEHYVAVGAKGHILRSKDAVSWQQMPSPTRALLTDITFVDEQNGWAVGHEQTILHTQNGGQTWQLQHATREPNKSLYKILSLDNQRLIAVGGNGLMLKTNNAGQTWQTLAMTDSEDEDFTPATLPADLRFLIDDIVQLNDGSLLTSGEFGVIMHSSDSGDTWRMLQSPYIAPLFGAVPHGPKGVIVFGLRGNVFVTDDVTAIESQDPYDFDYSDLNAITDPAELQQLGWRKLKTYHSQSIYGGKSLSNGGVLLLGDKGVAHLVYSTPTGISISKAKLQAYKLPIANYANEDFNKRFAPISTANSDFLVLDQKKNMILLVGAGGVKIAQFRQIGIYK